MSELEKTAEYNEKLKKLAEWYNAQVKAATKEYEQYLIRHRVYYVGAVVDQSDLRAD